MTVKTQRRLNILNIRIVANFFNPLLDLWGGAGGSGAGDQKIASPILR